MLHRRADREKPHVRGYEEEGTITIRFAMTVLTDMGRSRLMTDTIDRLPRAGDECVEPGRMLEKKLLEHERRIAKHGEGMSEVRTPATDTRR